MSQLTDALDEVRDALPGIPKIRALGGCMVVLSHYIAHAGHTMTPEVLEAFRKQHAFCEDDLVAEMERLPEALRDILVKGALGAGPDHAGLLLTPPYGPAQ